MYDRALRGGSLEFTVYIIMKVSGTGYLEKKHFFTIVQTNMFYNPRSTKTQYWVVQQNTFFYKSIKNVYITLQVGKNTVANKTVQKKLYKWTW